MIKFDQEKFEQRVREIITECMDLALYNYAHLLQEKDKHKGDPDQLLTKKQAAKLLSCSTSTVDNLRRAGKIKRHYVGNSVRFKKSELLDALKITK